MGTASAVEQEKALPMACCASATQSVVNSMEVADLMARDSCSGVREIFGDGADAWLMVRSYYVGPLSAPITNSITTLILRHEEARREIGAISIARL